MLPSWAPCPMPSCCILIWPSQQTSLGQTRWSATACLKTISLKDKEGSFWRKGKCKLLFFLIRCLATDSSFLHPTDLVCISDLGQTRRSATAYLKKKQGFFLSDQILEVSVFYIWLENTYLLQTYLADTRCSFNSCYVTMSQSPIFSWKKFWWMFSNRLAPFPHTVKLWKNLDCYCPRNPGATKFGIQLGYT